MKFQKRLLITMQGEILEAIHFQDVVHTVEEVKPAHLGWNLQYILPEVQNKVVVGAFTQAAIYVHVLPKTESKWKTQTTVCIGARVHAGILIDVIHYAVGDGGGFPYSPTSDMTRLKNEVWRGDITNYEISAQLPNVIRVDTLLPSDAGGFTIREMGLFDKENRFLVL